MITIEEFTKRDPHVVGGKGKGIFEYQKFRIVKNGKEMTTISIDDALDLRDALIQTFPPQGMLLPHAVIRLGEPYAP